jgi:hypothetical protein
MFSAEAGHCSTVYTNDSLAPAGALITLISPPAWYYALARLESGRTMSAARTIGKVYTRER